MIDHFVRAHINYIMKLRNRNAVFLNSFKFKVKIYLWKIHEANANLLAIAIAITIYDLERPLHNHTIDRRRFT